MQAGGLTVTGDTFFKGRIYCKGGDAGGGGETHFPYTNGENYIRGHTNHSGDLRMLGSIAGPNNNLIITTNLQVDGTINCNQFSKIRSGKMKTELTGFGLITFTPPFPDGSIISISCTVIDSITNSANSDLKYSVSVRVHNLDNKSCRVLTTGIPVLGVILGPSLNVTTPISVSVSWIAVQN